MSSRSHLLSNSDYTYYFKFGLQIYSLDSQDTLLLNPAAFTHMVHHKNIFVSFSPSVVFLSILPDLTPVLTIFRFHSKTSLLSRLCVTTIASFQRNRNLMKHTSASESLTNEKSWNLLQLIISLHCSLVIQYS